MRARRRFFPRRAAAVRIAPAAFKILPTVLAVWLVSAWPSQAWSGAWARDRGEAYVKASVARLEAREIFDASGAVRPLLDPATYDRPRYRELGAALYVEYGLLRAVTVVGSLPLKEATQEAEGRFGAGGIYGESFGFGDFHLGLRVPIHRGRWAASAEPDLKIPLRRDAPNRPSDPALGTGFTDLGAALAVGAGIPRVRGYAQGSVGYRIRGGRAAEETYWDLEVGVAPARPFRARLRYDAVDSRGAGALGAGAPSPSAGEQDFHRLAPTLAVALSGNREVAVTWRRILGGRSTIRSSEWEVGFSFLGSLVPAFASDAP